MKRAAIVTVLILCALAIMWTTVRIVAPRPSLHAVEAPSLTRFGSYRPGINLRQAFESLPPAGGEQTNLTLLTENLEAWAARWRMLDGARHSIDISYFILREDVFGAAFLGHLLQKAREGVPVRLMLDSQGTVMSFTSPRGNDWLDTLANTKNVKVKLFRPIVGRYLEAIATGNPVAAFASEHDKIMVCDRALSMIGGRNISTEYFAHAADFPKAYQDVDIVLQSRSVARGLTSAFETQFKSDGAHANASDLVDLTSYTDELLLAYRAMDAWMKAKPLDPKTANQIRSLKLSWLDDLKKLPHTRNSWSHIPAPDANAETRLLDSYTRLEAEGDGIGKALMRLVQSSRKRILLHSPYLVLSDDAIDALAEAGKRGTQITIYTNSPISSDNAISQAFFQEQWPELLARVPNLRLFVTGGKRTLHSKVMVFDDQAALVGTYNLDPVSMGVNSEIMAAVWSTHFAHEVAAQARNRIARGAPSVYEYRIKRDKNGRAVRDDNGRVVVAFGPRDHADPMQWKKVQMVWALLRVADKVPGFPELF